MSGTPDGGKQTALTNKQKDPDFYKKIGALGGAVPHPETRPWGRDPEAAREAGRKGGSMSRRKMTPEERTEWSRKMLETRRKTLGW
jgi:general stress protein YciG